MDAEKVLFGGRGHGERMPLEVGDGGAVEEDILAHLHLETVLHQLQLEHLGRSDHNLDATILKDKTRTESEWNDTLHDTNTDPCRAFFFKIKTGLTIFG